MLPALLIGAAALAVVFSALGVIELLKDTD